MEQETNKLQIIEEILKINDNELLSQVKVLISRNKTSKDNRRSFQDLSGIMTEEELNQMEKAINKACEIINPND